MNVIEEYLRWRHSKGYGVHSPYAYRFITDVLNPGSYGYYAFDRLTTIIHSEKNSRTSYLKEARFLIRLCMFLKCKRIINPDVCYPEAKTVAKALNITYFCFNTPGEIKFREGDLLLLSPPTGIKTLIVNQAIGSMTPVLAINPEKEIRKILETPIPKGLLLDGKSKILLIPRREMDYVCYTLKF